MAISLVAWAKAYEGANTNSLTLTISAGEQADDFGIIFACADDDTVVNPTMAITVATGWTLLDSVYCTTGRNSAVWVWYKKFTSSSEANPVITMSHSQEHSASLHVFRGVHKTVPLDAAVEFVFAELANDYSAPTPPDITTIGANSAIILFLHMTHGDINGIFSYPSGYTGSTMGGYGTAYEGAQQQIAYDVDVGAAGFKSPGNWSINQSTNIMESRQYTIALREASQDPQPVTKVYNIT